MNIECTKEAIEEIKSSFKFNDSIIRDIILLKKWSQLTHPHHWKVSEDSS